MSQITEEIITKTANLAKIDLSKEEKANFATQIDKIINWVEKLSEIDTENSQIYNSPYNMTMRLEKDEISDGDIAEDVLSNSKEPLYGYFSVPKVID